MRRYNQRMTLLTDEERCRATALRILSHRWNSAQELEAKLRSKQFERPLVDRVIQSLREEGWIDDRRYAESAAREATRKNLGARRIERELAHAGVDAIVARTAIAAVVDGAGEEARLADVCRKKIRIMLRRSRAALSDEKGRNKLVSFLLKQGYEYAAVREVVEAELKSQAERNSSEESGC